MTIKNVTALGIYGGASLNCIELALLRTDGIDVHEYLMSSVVPYSEELALGIRKIIDKRGYTFAQLENAVEVQDLRERLSDFYVASVKEFASANIEVIGVDGLTVVNDPENHCSYQLEDGHRMAETLPQKIITHFHKADLLSGGQAAPLTPSFFSAVSQHAEKPLLFIDVEAVSSLVYIGEYGEMIAFECAPGMAMLEDWTFRHANMQTDYNGKSAATGTIDRQVVESLLHHKFLRRNPPKSLDIMCFSDKKEHLEGLSLENGAATATAFIAEAIYQAAINFLPAIPSHIYLSGQAVKNPTLVRFLQQNFAPRHIENITHITPALTAVGAQATAFNTVRRLYGLPITFPSTTGAYEPMTGGEIYEKR